MTIELAMAALIATLGLFQVVWAAAEYRRVHGLAYANGARDTGSEKADSPLLGRLTRAQSNLMETAPYFIGLALIITAAGVSSNTTRMAAQVFVAARLIYLPLYALGVPYIRGMVWTISFIALSVMAYAAVAAVSWSHVLTFGG